MKKVLLLILIFIIFFAFCSCGNTPSIEEGTLLYDCGIKSIDDIDKCVIVYDDPDNPVKVTDFNDLLSLVYYKDSGACPSELLPEVMLFPGPKRINITFGDKSCWFFLMEDGTIVTPVGSTHEYIWLYKASEENILTLEKIEEICEKYK